MRAWTLNKVLENGTINNVEVDIYYPKRNEIRLSNGNCYNKNQWETSEERALLVAEKMIREKIDELRTEEARLIQLKINIVGAK